MAENKKNTAKENSENAKEAIKFHADDIFAALTDAKKQIDEQTTQTITVCKSDGDPLFAFDIRPLTETEYDTCRVKATNNGELDQSRQKSEIIYMATVDEDKGIWTNKQFMDSIDTLFYTDVINEVLRAGDKTRIVNAIDILSGFGVRSKTVDIAEEVKNL